MEKDGWRIWDKFSSYGDLLHKRATGELEEMESAKSLCALTSKIYRPGMKILDVGCGAGHYLRSLRKRVDKNIDYTGVDATKYYIQRAKDAFGDNVSFALGDIYDLNFPDNSFDIVMSNNLLLHLPPPPTKAISELVRVSRTYVIIRTVFGERNYIVKECRKPEEIFGEKQNLQFEERDVISHNGEAKYYNYFNMYTEDYFIDIVRSIDQNADVKVEIDHWNEFDNRGVGGHTATWVTEGKQISGNLILDWRFAVISKKDKI